MNKTALRATYLAKRRSLSAAENVKLSRQIADRFFTDFDLKATETLHCFISIPKFNEIDTSLIFSKLWSDSPHIRTVAPRVDRKNDRLENVLFSHDSEMVENAWGIREPAGEEMVEPEKTDLVIVPLLCFEKGGYRVGYGKGYYDRFLAKCRPGCIKVGLSFFPPVDQIDGIHDGDVPLDYCVTPEKTYRTAAVARC